MEPTVDDIKNLLTDTEIITRFIIESDYTSSEDPDHPTEFWNVKKFTYRINMENLRKPREEEWQLIHSFQTKTLEHAISHCILGTTTQDVFNPCPLPERLKDYWMRHKFIITQSITSKIKWDEKRINRSTQFELFDYIRDKEIKSYEGGRWKIDYLLSELPSILVKLSEGLPFGFTTSDVLKHNPVERFPWFLYKNKLYKSTYYIHDQKCICGDPVDSISGENIKVEAWSVQKFYKKDEIYIDDNTIFYNGITQPFVKNESIYMSNEAKQQLKLMFPDAERYNCDMESGNL